MLSHGEPVTFYRPGQRSDPYSQATVRDDWTAPEKMLTEVCGVEPTGSTEPDAVDRDSVTIRFRLYLGRTVAIDPTWRAKVRGEMLEVIGHPAQWLHPMTGWDAGTVVEVGVTHG